MIRRIEIFPPGRRSAVADYLRDMEKDRRERARINIAFDTVAEIQVPPSSVFKKLVGHADLWEIRVGAHRFLGALHAPDLFVVLHAFRKQTQKTPP